MYGYGGGPLAGAYGGPANLVNPKMEEWRAQQKSSKGIERNSAAQNRIARAQQTGVGRGTQEQIVRHTTPGGGGYNRAEAMARERQLATRPLAEQMAMLGRKANPNAGDKSLEGMEGAINVDYTQGGGPLKGDEKGTKWTPEARKRWQQDQKDLQNPFGPRIRKDEEGKWSAEQKEMWRRGETPRQQMAGITGGEAGMERARRRMAANTGQPMRTAGTAEAPWKIEEREAAEAAEAAKAKAMAESRASQMGGGAGSGPMRQAGGGRRSIWGGFRGSKLGGAGGFMSQAIKAAQAKKGGGGMFRRSPGSKGAISNSGYDPKKISGFGGSRRRLGGATAPKRRTGGIGGASKTGASIRSRGLRGRGISGAF